MPKKDVEKQFPALKGTEYDLSDEDFNYNCLAYALGDKSNWWEPPNRPGQYWPPGFPDDLSVKTVESIIRSYGFTVDNNLARAPETDAIAIYAEGEDWTHFAKFADGSWSCKLGDGHDVLGVQLEHFAGKLYGKLFKILSRPKAVLK